MKRLLDKLFRRQPAVRDDTLRAGQPGPELSGKDAALRATGKNAWMRPGGF